MSVIYLDNNATTPTDPLVLQKMTPYFVDTFGNPNSKHQIGRDTLAGLKDSSAQIYSSLNIDDKDTLIFTSCATESINTVHKSFLLEYLKHPTSKNQIISSSLEHDAVLKSLDLLEEFGIEVIYLPEENHSYTVESFKKYYNPDRTLLVSLAMVNSETGIIHPISEIAQICHLDKVPVHCDATQGVGKIHIDVSQLNVDFLSFSGHKFHAPKGIGGLIIKESLIPMLHGAGKTFRAGTLNTAYIVGIGEALQLAVDIPKDEILRLRELLEDFLSAIPDCTIHGKEQKRIPNTTFFSIESIESDYIQWYLDENNICVSTGSACSILNSEKPRGVRVSLSRFTKEQDILTLIDTLKKMLKNYQNTQCEEFHLWKEWK